MKMKKKLLAALLASALAAGMLPTSACAVSSAYTSSNATLISFTDSAVTADGKYSGYEIEGTDVSITAAGTYVFSGDCDDGSITVKKGVTGVTLVLNGLTLTNADSAAITLNKTAEAALIAAAGSENTVADTAGANDENAAVKVKSGASLSLSGTGTLTACGNVKNGIKGASDAVITVDEMTLNIEAADDGLSCDDELTIKGGRVNITAGGDAVKASPDTDDTENPDTTSLGSVTISGGTITLEGSGGRHSGGRRPDDLGRHICRDRERRTYDRDFGRGCVLQGPQGRKDADRFGRHVHGGQRRRCAARERCDRFGRYADARLGRRRSARGQ